MLVVDDDPTNRALLSAQLRFLRPASTIVDKGITALQHLRGLRFDIVLLDIMMPGMNGMQTLAALRSAESAEGRWASPVIAFTALERDELPAKVDQAFTDILTKPITLQALRHCLETWVPGYRERAAGAA